MGQAYGRRPPHRHPAVVHTLHLYPGWAGSSPAQPLCWSEAKNIPAPQTQLCAFTDSHCVAHSNTCTYFSMASLASTTRSLSVHMSCVPFTSESGNRRAQESSTCNHRAGIAFTYLCDIILKVRGAVTINNILYVQFRKKEEMKFESLTDEAHTVHGLSRWGDMRRVWSYH